MASVWTSSLANFGAACGAINASAIQRGGKLTVVEVEAMHSSLDILAQSADISEREKFVRQLRALLPERPEFD